MWCSLSFTLLLKSSNNIEDGFVFIALDVSSFCSISFQPERGRPSCCVSVLIGFSSHRRDLSLVAHSCLSDCSQQRHTKSSPCRSRRRLPGLLASRSVTRWRPHCSPRSVLRPLQEHRYGFLSNCTNRVKNLSAGLLFENWVPLRAGHRDATFLRKALLTYVTSVLWSSAI